MKANKALKRLSKVEALISKVAERYSAGTHEILEALQEVKVAVVRAKAAVSSDASTKTVKKVAPARTKVTVKKTAAKTSIVKTAKKHAPIRRAAKVQPPTPMHGETEVPIQESIPA
jgi:hypothetical protein